jgi:hypothetical protein
MVDVTNRPDVHVRLGAFELLARHSSRTPSLHSVVLDPRSDPEQTPDQKTTRD